MRQGMHLGWVCLMMWGLTACGGGDGAEKTARLSLSITDGPVDTVSSVVLQIRGVVLTREADGQEFRHEYPTPRQINLLEYQGKSSAKLLDVDLPEGQYSAVRLLIDHELNIRDSYVVSLAGEECELNIPSTAQSLWTIRYGISLRQSTQTALTIDVDLYRSILGTDCAAGYVFRPALTLLPDASSGWIAGEVDAALVRADCLPKVYVFFAAHPLDDLDVAVPVQIGGPQVIAQVKIENGATAYRYHTPRLLHNLDPRNISDLCRPGQPCPDQQFYLLAFTCDDDDPTRDDPVNFQGALIADVKANTTSIVNFTY